VGPRTPSPQLSHPQQRLRPGGYPGAAQLPPLYKRPRGSCANKPLAWGGAGVHLAVISHHYGLMQPAFIRHHRGRSPLQQRTQHFPCPCARLAHLSQDGPLPALVSHPPGLRRAFCSGSEQIASSQEIKPVAFDPGGAPLSSRILKRY